jgi:hypothetical protein
MIFRSSSLERPAYTDCYCATVRPRRKIRASNIWHIFTRYTILSRWSVELKTIFLSLLATCIVATSACTTLQPTEATPEELQRLIVSEGILEVGERVRLVTSDESEHKFRIKAIDTKAGFVYGEDESVPIEDIVAVETREVSAGKTALLTGGLVYGVGMIIAIAIAPAAILGGL